MDVLTRTPMMASQKRCPELDWRLCCCVANHRVIIDLSTSREVASFNLVCIALLPLMDTFCSFYLLLSLSKTQLLSVLKLNFTFFVFLFFRLLSLQYLIVSNPIFTQVLLPAQVWTGVLNLQIILLPKIWRCIYTFTPLRKYVLRKRQCVCTWLKEENVYARVEKKKMCWKKRVITRWGDLLRSVPFICVWHWKIKLLILALKQIHW